MNDEPMCPNHPDRKATMPTLEGPRCLECFFAQRQARRMKDKQPIVVEDTKR